MNLDWEAMFRRYLMDDAKTPYMVPVGRLTRSQAGHELFVYVLFLSVFFGVLSVATLSPSLPHGNAAGVPLYAFSVLAVAIAFGMTKALPAAAYCAAAPVGVLIYFALYGFQPTLGSFEKVAIVTLILVWVRYSWRVLAIARAYPELTDKPPEG